MMVHGLGSGPEVSGGCALQGKPTQAGTRLLLTPRSYLCSGMSLLVFTSLYELDLLFTSALWLPKPSLQTHLARPQVYGVFLNGCKSFDTPSLKRWGLYTPSLESRWVYGCFDQ